MFVAMAPILVPVAIWLYALVFAFSSLWFAHYTLAALEQLRKTNSVSPPGPFAPMAMKPTPEALPIPAPAPGGQPDSRI